MESIMMKYLKEKNEENKKNYWKLIKKLKIWNLHLKQNKKKMQNY